MDSGAAGSSLTISVSLRADMVIDPCLATFAGTDTRTPTSRSVAVSRTESTEASTKHVGKDGQGLSRLDDVVHELQTPDEGITIHMDFHRDSPLFRKERKTLPSSE